MTTFGADDAASVANEPLLLEGNGLGSLELGRELVDKPEECVGLRNAKRFSMSA